MMRKLAGLLLVAVFVSVLLSVFPVRAKDISAGPIWNNMDAQNKCPSVCARERGTWNGNWHTVVPGRNSVCSCDFNQRHRGKEDFNAGPIWSNQQAQTVCPAVCTSHDRLWKGEWRTTVQGQMSVCTCHRR